MPASGGRPGDVQPDAESTRDYPPSLAPKPLHDVLRCVSVTLLHLLPPLLPRWTMGRQAAATDAYDMWSGLLGGVWPGQ